MEEFQKNLHLCRNLAEVCFFLCIDKQSID